MDFGQLGLDTTTFFSNNGEINKHKCYGFGFLKQERAVNEDESREFKLARTCSSSRSNGGSEQNQQMLSFSSPQSSFYHHSSNAFARNTVGYGCTVGINGGSSMQEGVVRGPFTPSQWMELEHQALIYKYITANVPIPSYLLNPITKAFHSARFSAAFRSTALGWGGFQLGFANTDPEPGRCRRTDGKKWRCSRDAMPDQKYCERHMNRGRHRSRKPVEGQSAPVPPAANGRSSAAGGVSNTLGLSSLHPPSNNPLSGLPRSLLDKENTNGAYQHAPKVGPKDHNDYSAQQEFGLVCSDSLLNPLNTSSSLVEHKSQHALRQFMDDWPKTQLSISIPMVTSDFMSSTSSPTNENLTGLEMGLGVDRDQRQTNWIPISWEPSMGGPLGEVLHTTGECKPLNLIDSWDNSPRLASSPTGVLQRGPFVSLSNSSAASSPRAQTNGLINPGLVNPSLPAL